MRIRFTNTFLVELTSTTRVTYYDVNVPGLAVRVTPAGSKTFIIYKRVLGRPQRITLGAFPAMKVEAARREAQALLAEIAEGKDPQQERHKLRTTDTLGRLFERYLEEHIIPEGKGTTNPQQYWRLYLERWSTRRLDAVTRTDLQRLRAELGRANKRATFNKCRAQLQAMYRRAATWGYTGESPVTGVPPFVLQARRRFLKSEEIPRFIDALNQEPEQIRDFFYLALLTGARKSNLLSMRGSHVMSTTWTVPANMSKNGQAIDIPLVPAAAEIVARRSKLYGRGPLFPGRGARGHMMDPKRAFHRVLKRAELEDVHIHDLRRTLGSWMAASNTSLHIIGRALGHSSTAATAIYARLDVDPVRDAMQQATDKLFKK